MGQKLNEKPFDDSVIIFSHIRKVPILYIIDIGSLYEIWNGWATLMF